MPKLPVAKQMWTPEVGLEEGAKQWMRYGGGHHTVLTLTLSEAQLKQLAETPLQPTKLRPVKHSTLPRLNPQLPLNID